MLIEHATIHSQSKADKLAEQSTKQEKLCRSCIAVNINNRRWADPANIEKQSQRFLHNNPSKGKPAWNRGVPRDLSTKKKIQDTKKNNGSSSGNRNSNYGNFKYHNTQQNFKQFRNRVVVLTERVKHLVDGYSEVKRGKTNVEGAYQIDHIKPIIDCWYDGWTPEQAADVTNLRFIPWEENLKLRKWRKHLTHRQHLK
jgi:hypothetical protein